MDIRLGVYSRSKGDISRILLILVVNLVLFFVFKFNHIVVTLSVVDLSALKSFNFFVNVSDTFCM